LQLDGERRYHETVVESFLAELDAENLAALERIGAAAAREPAGDIDVARLLKVALKNEIEATECAAAWISTTREMDVKLASHRARQATLDRGSAWPHRHLPGQASLTSHLSRRRDPAGRTLGRLDLVLLSATLSNLATSMSPAGSRAAAAPIRSSAARFSASSSARKDSTTVS